ncbi:MAG: AAA family ATPase, partial [Muribaculaceae bacterium]|nr:AAA family ATPase [Muribaculaceae bacterium]
MMNKKYHIDKDYYKYCLQTADKIEAFIKELMNDKDLLHDVIKTNGLEAIDTDMFGDYNSRIVTIVLYDLWKCYVGMGFDVEPEALPMLCYSMSIYNLSASTSSCRLTNGILAEDIREIKELQKVGCQYMKLASVLNPYGYENGTSFLMLLYFDRSGRNREEYLNLLHDISVCMADAYDVFPWQAKIYLEKIKPGEQKASSESNKETDAEGKNNVKSELDELIGLAEVKNEIKKLSSFVKVQQWRSNEGLKHPVVSYHCVFTGNPGTGKTTVARILAGIFKELGLLKRGHLVETDRSGLVAEYVGQTAVKTNKIIDSALDGVLFIDEAYSLVSEGTGEYGYEAIATLLKRMEDNRDRLVVILAGYGNEMRHFIKSNPGLKSRFNRYFHFEDYSSSELWEIFNSMLGKHDYVIEDEAKIKLRLILDKAVQNHDRYFGNARYVRNLFEKIIENQAMRLS